jgi:hypothetical protein
MNILSHLANSVDIWKFFHLTTLPPAIYGDLEAHLSRVKKLHEADLDTGYGDIYLPGALVRKYGSASVTRILSCSTCCLPHLTTDLVE